MPEDLWPDNIADSHLTTPVAMLKEQGALLGEKTRQLVKGEVATTSQGQMFIHSFYITSPTLRYRYELFTVTHSVSFYPLTLEFQHQKTTHKDEEDFRGKLKAVLNDPHTVNVVHSILAQTRE